ncbi:IucA/IucC family protein [Jiangella asiatica]|uniref:IucA/IucC family siderophore biosynthesis protein n=1 Tax=Jiangella asiatica TaxID=2530372 RepID=A0A4R5DM02_9ACTN|nr:IucA/IucC family siderophore biosynthesis protein [Jiangella asiatica]TDE13070.1 IucA/IucC family siderophore biosynthesis protein [Jiangella asiatica]
MSDSPILAALTPQHWDRANRELIAKMITEFWYEEIITPAVTVDGALRLALPGGLLTGRAVRRALGWWRVDPSSLAFDGTGGDNGEDGDGASGLPDAVDVFTRLLGDADPSTVAGSVSELSSTLLSDARQLAQARPATELVDLEPVLVESQLTGHPWIVASKGRVGFSVSDLEAYPPEAGRDVQLLWLAAAPDLADVATVPGLDHHTVVREQVGPAGWEQVRARARLGGLDPDTCVYLPVHPWQWTHRIVPLHASALADGSLVFLGEGSARYRPQLAIRTMTDIDDPTRRYLKLPVSILNTSVYRGLPRERTLAAPALTSWLASVVDGDDFLRETGVILLGEVAGVSVTHPAYASLPGVPYQYTELLGAIWREPVQPYLAPGEQAVSLAALLHVDPWGGSFAEALVARSGLTAAEWVARLHGAILPPLLHVLYRYGAMFSPHGQNCMIVHRSGVPVRLVVKDFVDDLAICSELIPEHAGLTPAVRAALSDVTLDGKTLRKYLQNGLLICVYRYLAEIAADRLGVPESSFWGSARAVLSAYRSRFAGQLGDRFEMFDLETPTFPKLCLNRLRLFDRGYADDAERPVVSAVGSVANPLAPEFPG